jgi:putative ABC transport system ATP-binding protein
MDAAKKSCERATKSCAVPQPLPERRRNRGVPLDFALKCSQFVDGAAAARNRGARQQVTVTRTFLADVINLNPSVSYSLIVTTPITEAMIQVRDVSRQFEGRTCVTALNRVSLNITHGEMVSIVGPSGSGKSTLLNLIGGLDRATSGAIVVDGESLAHLSDDKLTRVRRDKIGFIFQFFNLLPTLSCLENVGLPLHLRGWPRGKVADRARELLALVGLNHRLSHLPEELSGGERQRVAIARALSIFPPILLADEPTGNLDSHTGEEILALIHDLHARLGSTVVIVTHDMNVAQTCDRTITLRDGRIVDLVAS